MDAPSSIKILVIDDEPIVREVICATLGLLGYTALAAEDGASGLEILRREKTPVVFTDMILPEMDGEQIIAEIRRIDPNVFIVSVSGVTREGISSDAVLQKPFTQGELQQVLAKALAHIARTKR